MTDPSLYSFSDQFYTALQNSQKQIPEEYYQEVSDDTNSSDDEDENDYDQQISDLNDKYEEQVNLNKQLQSQLDNYSQYSLDADASEDDPSYVTSFIYKNILDAPKSSNSNFQSFGTYEEGKNALIHQLTLYQTGKTRNPVGPNSSLLDAMNVYAPSSDHNDPKGYAEFIAKKLGVTTDTPISQLNTHEWADAVEKMEGNKVGNNPGNLRKYKAGGIVNDLTTNINMPIHYR